MDWTDSDGNHEPIWFTSDQANHHRFIIEFGAHHVVLHKLIIETRHPDTLWSTAVLLARGGSSTAFAESDRKRSGSPIGADRLMERKAQAVLSGMKIG